MDRLWLTLGGWPRKAVVVLLLAVAGLLAVSGPHHSNAATSSVAIVVAGSNLSSGVLLTAADVSMARWPAAVVPADVVRDPAAVLGKPLGADLAAGEPVTRHRLLDTTISAALDPGQVAVSVQLAQAPGTTIVHAGAVIDLYATQQSATGAPAAPASPVAAGVPVLAVLTADQNQPSGSGSALSTAAESTSTTVVIACDQAAAARIALNSAAPFIATLRPDP